MPFLVTGSSYGIDVPQNAHEEITAARLNFLKIGCPHGVELPMTTDREPGPPKKGPERRPSTDEDKILLDLANALTALGNHLALATGIRQNASQSGTGNLDQVLEKCRAQHERAVWSLRELQKALQN